MEPVEARFVGGPLDGEFTRLELPWPIVLVNQPPAVDHVTILPVWIEGYGIADASGSFLVPKTGHYERDGLPNQPPYVYSWRG